MMLSILPTQEGNILYNNTLKIAPIERGFLALIISNANLYHFARILCKKPDPGNIHFTIYIETSLSNSRVHSDAFPLTDRHQSSSQLITFIYIGR